MRSFRSPSPTYPHIQLDAERLLLALAPAPFRLMAALGCLDLEPPPSTRYLYSLSGCTARRGCAASSLTRPAVAIFTWTPFEMHASLTSLGLVSRLVVTDLTPNFAFPPVPDYHPRYRESC